jgi:hypothetical protein
MKGILLNNDLDLAVKNGTLLFGETTAQNQKILLLSNKGEFKTTPMRGVGIGRYLENSEANELAREIRTEFVIDGMTVNSIQIGSDLELKVEASYDS